MKKTSLNVALSLALGFSSLSALATAQTPQRGFTVEDLVKMERISAPALSPDGSKVVYQVRATDLDKNRGRSDLWLLDLSKANATPQRLTENLGNNMQAAWNGAGDAIYFISTRSGSAQVWQHSFKTNLTSKVTDYPLDVASFKVSPQDDRIAFSVEVFRDCPDFACTAQRLESNSKNKATGKIYEHLLYRHWDTWSDGRRLVLFSAALQNQVAATPVSLSGSLDADVHSKPDGDAEEYAFSADGKSIVFSARVGSKTEAWSTNFDLYQVAAQGGNAPKNLTQENPAWDTKPAFSPDGKTMAYLAMKHPGFEADRFQIMLLDLATGKKSKLAEKWDRSAQHLQWSADSKSLYTSTNDLGQVRLFQIEVANHKVHTLSDQGSVADFDVQGNTLLIAQANLASGVQLFTRQQNNNQWQQITQQNKQLLADVRFGEYEQFSFAGAKGEKVHGYVMKPWNAKAGEKYPVAFLVHGGPQSSFANNWSYRWNPQTYAGSGYAVVFIDFHGSIGYGQDFTDSISQDWGGKPLVDLQKGMEAASKKFPWLDKNNACALGASYGGYMMNWIAGQWSDGFKCIVNHAGIFDTRSMYYTTEELWFTEWENGGTYYDVPAKHEKHNPTHFVKNWKTPMLVTQGELDFRVPSAQSFAAFTALQRRGIDSQFLIFPDENHHILKPANSLLWHKTVINWLDKYTKINTRK
jgi:dipeptidyl aminopeptidase/acylaminoacyl peptidase